MAKKVKKSDDITDVSRFDRIRKKFRIAISDVDSFEFKRFILVSRWNIIIGSLFLLIVIVALTWTIIAFTPLRHSIPGYPNKSKLSKTQRLDVENLKLLEELQKKEKITAQYNKNLIQLLNELEPEDLSYQADSIKPLDSSKINKIDFKTSEADGILRNKVKNNDKYGVNNSKETSSKDSENFSGVYFFTPLKGEVSGDIDVKKGHYGIDVKAPKNEAVKATLGGTVIYTDWSSENGYVIHVQHSHNLVSVYKHNSVLLKNQGERVKTGEPIAIVGNSGSLSLGTHLHFELWYNGVAQNPKQFINFE